MTTNPLRKPIRRRLRAYRHRRRDLRRIRTALASARPIVLVHQMGKVGSRSVLFVLSDMGEFSVFHTHWCNEQNLAHRARIVDESRRISNRYGDRDHFGQLFHEQTRDLDRPIKVVSMFRDPVARNISSYFQHLDEIWGVRKAHLAISTDELIRGFFEVFEHDEPLDWFDTEIRSIHGIDVFDHPFDTEARHATIESGRCSLLLMRVDLPDATKRSVLSEFLGKPVPEIPRANTAAAKSYSDAYRAFKDSLVVPGSYLDRFYDSRLVRHFLSPDERAKLRAHWLA